jgi:hypothetical protein
MKGRDPEVKETRYLQPRPVTTANIELQEGTGGGLRVTARQGEPQKGSDSRVEDDDVYRPFGRDDVSYYLQDHWLSGCIFRSWKPVW